MVNPPRSLKIPREINSHILIETHRRRVWKVSYMLEDMVENVKIESYNSYKEIRRLLPQVLKMAVGPSHEVYCISTLGQISPYFYRRKTASKCLPHSESETTNTMGDNHWK